MFLIQINYMARGVKIEYKKGDIIGKGVLFIRELTQQGKKRICVFKCKCGNEFTRILNTVREGHTKTCGKCTKWASTKIHGLSDTVEHNTWMGMHRRCYKTNRKDYPDYGGRGVIVCDRWLNSFENFLADMGMRPSPKHSIDRFPNKDGNYEPNNCRWATPFEQANNKRNSVYITFLNTTMTAAGWSKIIKINGDTLTNRIRKGWPPNLTLMFRPNHDPLERILEKKKLEIRHVFGLINS